MKIRRRACGGATLTLAGAVTLRRTGALALSALRWDAAPCERNLHQMQRHAPVTNGTLESHS